MTPRRAANRIISILRQHGHQALLAGGCVRDLLLEREPADYDVATDAVPERVVELFRSTQRVGAKFGVVIVRMGGCETEVATFRSDGDYIDGRRPENVRYTTASEDARRRDFTINGMFFDPETETVIDYVGGRADLAAGIVRCIGDPERRFSEDHLRMLRAVRFAARFGFSIHHATFDAIRNQAAALSRISPERIRMELELILAHPSRADGWQRLVTTTLHHHITGGAVSWDTAQAQRTGRICAALPPDVPLPAAIAALFAHLSPARTNQVCRLLRFSNEMCDAVEQTLSWTVRLVTEWPTELADLKTLRASAQYTSIKALAGAMIDADGARRAPLDDVIRDAERIDDDRIAPPPLIRGDDLLSLGVAPGPTMGKILTCVYRAQLNEQVHDRSEAITLARSLIEQQAGW